MGATGSFETFVHSNTPLKTETAFSSETLLSVYHTTLRHIILKMGTECFSKNVGSNKSSKFNFVITP
jgi:hypothetical protein